MTSTQSEPTISVTELKQARHRNLVFFLAVLVSLYVVTQLRQQRVAVMCVLAVYVVAATLWVRVQYKDQLAGWPGNRPASTTWPKVTTGLGATAVLGGGAIAGVEWLEGVRWLISWLIVAGLGALYLGAGYWIAASRQRKVTPSDRAGWKRVIPPYSTWKGHAFWLAALLAVTALGVGLLAAGVAVSVAAPIALIPLVLVPWSLSLLSELAIDGAVHGGPLTKQWLWPASGVIGVAVAVGAAKSPGYGAAVLVLAGLVVAIASATMADIAIVLAVIALASLTPAQDDPDRPLTDASSGGGPNGQGLLVALGDSYMSGEGASIYVEGTDEGGQNECRRAETAWPMLTGRLDPFTSVVSFACSGADSYNLRHTPENAPAKQQSLAQLHPDPVEQFPGIQTQLDAYDSYRTSLDQPRKFRPALVVLSIGGNDAGFASIGMTCLAPGSCDDEQTNRLWSDPHLDRVENRLRQVYADVDATFPKTPVVVIPYVNPIGDEAPCSEAALETGDVKFLAKFLRRLNARIERTSEAFGFHFASTVKQALALRSLRLCDDASGNRPGLNFIGLRSVGGLADQQFNPGKWAHSSLHPNERGHTAIHEAFQRWLDQAQNRQRSSSEQQSAGLQVRLDLPRRTPPVPRTELLRERPGRCTTFGTDDPDGCKSRSHAWAVEQLGRQLAWPILPIAALVAALAWVGAVGFFARRRADFAQRHGMTTT